MTEKRFTNHIIKTDADGTMHSDGILDANEDNKIIIWNYFYIASLLNQLNDKNEQLKKQLNDITLNWTQNHIEFDKDELYVKDNNTEITLKGQNLFIQVFIPQIKEYFRFNYVVTGRKLEREYNTLKGDLND